MSDGFICRKGLSKGHTLSLIAAQIAFISILILLEIIISSLFAAISAALHPVASLIATPVLPPELSFLCGTLHFCKISDL